MVILPLFTGCPEGDVAKIQAPPPPAHRPQSTTMKPRWIDWLAAAAIAFTLTIGTTTSVADDLQPILYRR